MPLEAGLTSENYVALFDTVLKPAIKNVYNNEQLYVIDDNKPIHRAAIVMDWYSSHPQFQRISWPSNSPDLNIFGDIWTDLSREQGIDCNTKSMIQTWNNLLGNPNYFQRLIQFIPKRLAKVIVEKGAYSYTF